MSSVLAVIVDAVQKVLVAFQGNVLVYPVVFLIVSFAFQLPLRVLRRFRAEREWAERRRRDLANRAAWQKALTVPGVAGTWRGVAFKSKPPGWTDLEWRTFQYLKQSGRRVRGSLVGRLYSEEEGKRF